MTEAKMRFTSKVAISFVGNLAKLKHEDGVDTRILDKVRTGFVMGFLDKLTILGFLFRSSCPVGSKGVIDSAKEMTVEEAEAAVAELLAAYKSHFAIEKLSVSNPRPWKQL